MDSRIRLPRLNLRDVEDLLSAHSKLVSIDTALKGTNWAGAVACRILAGEVDMLVARLYNRAETRMVRPLPDQVASSSSSAPPAETAAPIEAPDHAPASDAAPPDKLARCIHGLPVEQHCGLCALGESST